jgi:carboxyl-terminal processing protease
MRSRRLTSILGLVIAFMLGAIVSRGMDVYQARAEANRPDLVLFWKAWDVAQENFVYRNALDSQKMIYGAIRGMIDALGDDGHSRFLTPDEVKAERSALRGQFDGIGAEVNVRNGRPVVVAPLEDSPAERAGLLAGDTIMTVDGVDVTSYTLTELVTKVRGARGTPVTLTVLHPGDSASVDLTIVRDEVKSPSVTWALVPGTTVGHVRISRFGQGTGREVTDAITTAKAAGADRLVLDLRNNPGGLLSEAIASASQVLKEGDVLLEEDASGARRPYPVRKGGIALDLPVAVLINRGSASASEIFAGAVQDHKRGTVVGERSFGTGTVLTPFNLDDGSQLYLGTSQWLTPSGRVIRKAGIQPDVTLQLPNNVRAISPREERTMSVGTLLERNDAQLLKAVELLGATLAQPAELAPAA